jgi:hypothetical protein
MMPQGGIFSEKLRIRPNNYIPTGISQVLEHPVFRIKTSKGQQFFGFARGKNCRIWFYANSVLK